jgi:hypothetical protein
VLSSSFLVLGQLKLASMIQHCSRHTLLDSSCHVLGSRAAFRGALIRSRWFERIEFNNKYPLLARWNNIPWKCSNSLGLAPLPSSLPLSVCHYIFYSERIFFLINKPSQIYINYKTYNYNTKENFTITWSPKSDKKQVLVDSSKAMPWGDSM